MTSSDYIPIIATISCNSITIPIKLRRQFRKADWDGYVRHLANHNLPTLTKPTLDEIDTQLDDCTKLILDATDKFIPTIRYMTIQVIKPNDYIQLQYDESIRYIYDNGPSIEILRQIEDLKRRLRDEYKSLQNDVWNSLISNLNINENPIGFSLSYYSSFWKTIRRLNGNHKQKIPYIRDSHNNQLSTPHDKERLFRAHWKNIH